MSSVSLADAEDRLVSDDDVLHPELPYRDLLDQVADGVYILDRSRKITFWSRGAERLTGYRADEVLGKCCAANILVHADCDGNILCGEETCPAARSMRLGEPCDERLFLKHKDGHRLPVRTSVRPLRDGHGRVVGAAEIFRCVSDGFAAAKQIEQLKRAALLDPLTGIGNRRLGQKELQDRLNETERYGWKFGVLFMDIDRFKQVNDIHGHEVGDRLLRMVALTLSHNVRSFDSVIRWGGEEFLVLLRNINHENLFSTANKLRALIESSRLHVDSSYLELTVSIGSTLARTEDTAEILVGRADALMFESKKSGGNRVSTDECDSREAQPAALDSTVPGLEATLKPEKEACATLSPKTVS
jgi:diguanylate cyclase (GGDEF)-like protein/PAS domain S-box-containing protein